MHRIRTACLTACLLLAGPMLGGSLLHAQTSADEQAIRTAMQRSADDWNRGDLDSFATVYKNSPDTIFMGSTVSRGYAGMLKTYKAHYATAEARGVLTFSNVEVHLLDANVATMIGNCHIERTSGKNDDCLYSLIWQKTAEGWKIVLDHSTAAPGKKS
ncbi:nuclear transport factor 2 family protein [Granulicella cerasi]|uniref:Nuclear transport factor 2 family protein n=1 Tax=Granulicella cerasi TaxID=741063 RepID=A0ABW1ZB78_9BACT|nr:nuclear transport factor 2 family protein [Granulicella cerasi]